MNKQLVQTVYVLTRIEDEILLPEIAYGFITEDNNIFQDRFNAEQILEQYPQKLGFKLLKPKEGIFFTQEEYNKHIKEIIENTLRSGAENAEIDYKEEKTIVKMYSSNKGEFEIEVVDGKAYYRKENKELLKEFIEIIIKSFKDEDLSFGGRFPYSVKTKTSVDVGCMENCRKEDWEKVYKLLK